MFHAVWNTGCTPQQCRAEWQAFFINNSKTIKGIRLIFSGLIEVHKVYLQCKAWLSSYCSFCVILNLTKVRHFRPGRRYILKYLLDFKNNLINIGCTTLYHLSMMYITVYNLSININYRILAVELNYRFTEISILFQRRIIIHQKNF